MVIAVNNAVPELPDIVVYLKALEQRILGQTLEGVVVASPFLLRTAAPTISSVEGKKAVELRRLGKRICIGLESDLWLVLHLMIAGRLHWYERSQVSKGSVSGRASRKRPSVLATFHFSNGALSLTEAGSRKRASLHLVKREDLQLLDPGGLEIFDADLENFAKVLTSANHTLKRALTDPRLFSGIGNAYSDEILWHARLSPVALTQKLKAEEIQRLFESTRSTLTKWVELLLNEQIDKERMPASSSVPRRKSNAQEGTSRGKEGLLAPAPVRTESPAIPMLAFPEKVTAFRPEMAVHGKYQQPCPRCGAKIQRIRYASNETNYCPNCQTGGKLLADRALSRLLRADWPRSAEELEGLTPTSKKVAPRTVRTYQLR